MRPETSQRARLLQWVLLIVGVTFIVGVYPLMLGWQSGWRWEPNQHEYDSLAAAGDDAR